MSRYIDADALISDMQERYCKPCKDKGEDYHEVRCRACWVDDAMDEIDGFADNSIDIVRCKECRHCLVGVATAQYSNGKQRIENLCEKHKWSVRADDYCAYGERKAMSRYIDAEALKDTHYNYATGELVPLAWADIEYAPHIDIVRCKECKYYKQSEAFCENGNGLWQAGDECFCNYGKREGE